MTRFVQLHYLTVYPPSNPNRDDQGRPKTAVYGGVPRLRLSSQSLKRAARLSDVMRERLQGHMGERTQRLGEEVRNYLLEQGADEARATDIARTIADIFGKVDDAAGDKGGQNPTHVRIRQLAFVSPEERAEAISGLTGARVKTPRRLKSQVCAPQTGLWICFGRMLERPYHREAAIQVSHAITTQGRGDGTVHSRREPEAGEYPGDSSERLRVRGHTHVFIDAAPLAAKPRAGTGALRGRPARSPKNARFGTAAESGRQQLRQPAREAYFGSRGMFQRILRGAFLAGSYHTERQCLITGLEPWTPKFDKTRAASGRLPSAPMFWRGPGDLQPFGLFRGAEVTVIGNDHSSFTLSGPVAAFGSYADTSDGEQTWCRAAPPSSGCWLPRSAWSATTTTHGKPFAVTAPLPDR